MDECLLIRKVLKRTTFEHDCLRVRHHGRAGRNSGEETSIDLEVKDEYGVFRSFRRDLA